MADGHVRNMEALMPRPDCASPFRDTTTFRHTPPNYTSYCSGKSFGRLDAPSLRAFGPHHFRTDADAGGRGSKVRTSYIPPSYIPPSYILSSSPLLSSPLLC